MTDCERHTEQNFNLIVMSPTVRHSGRSAFSPMPTNLRELSIHISAIRHSGRLALRSYFRSAFRLFGIPLPTRLKCELWSFNSLLLGSIPHTESVMYFTDCPAYQTVTICISN